jgi:catechol 2,3-dioxygenase
VRMHIGHLALRVTNPERSATFLSDVMGLRRTAESEDAILLSANEKHHEVEYLRGPRAGVDHLGLEIENERDLEALHERLVEAGVPILSDTPQEPGLGSAIRVLAPMGLVLELYTEMDREPLSVEHYMPVHARRLGHVSFASPDCSELRRFLVDLLGFRPTDTLGERVVWMRCDTDHHGIALVNTAFTGMHHYAFQLEDWGAIERYCDNLAFLGKRLVWGPGRHGPGRNLYTYIPDPENAIVEGYADLLQVVDEANYSPIDWDVVGESALNLWGPMPPENWREYGVPILAPTGALDAARNA